MTPEAKPLTMTAEQEQRCRDASMPGSVSAQAFAELDAERAAHAEVSELAGKVFKILDGAGIRGAQVNPAALEYLGPDQIAERLIAQLAETRERRRCDECPKGRKA